MSFRFHHPLTTVSNTFSLFFFCSLIFKHEASITDISPFSCPVPFYLLSLLLPLSYPMKTSSLAVPPSPPFSTAHFFFFLVMFYGSSFSNLSVHHKFHFLAFLSFPNYFRSVPILASASLWHQNKYVSLFPFYFPTGSRYKCLFFVYFCGFVFFFHLLIYRMYVRRLVSSDRM